MPDENNPFEGRIVADRYKLIKSIGQGGFGFVYVAEHIDLGRRFAIKFLHRQHEADVAFLKRFKREARVTAQLVHPHIVTVTDYGSDEMLGNYFVMEYLDGSPLDEMLEAKGPLGSQESVHIMRQIVEGFVYAHDKGIVHRDVKSPNVFLVEDASRHNHVKILDFGIARIAEGSMAGEVDKLTSTGSVMGSVAYMSPEQAMAGEIDHRSDIYSLGIVLYEMITGVTPFRGNSALEILSKQVSEEPVPPSQIAEQLDVHPYLEMIILQCLQKTPEGRFQNAKEMLDALLKAEDSIRTRTEVPGDILRTTTHLKRQIIEEGKALASKDDDITIAAAATRAPLVEDTVRTPMEEESFYQVAGKKSAPMALLLGTAALVVLVAVGLFFVLRGSSGAKEAGAQDDGAAVAAIEEPAPAATEPLVPPAPSKVEAKPEPEPEPEPEPKPAPIAFMLASDPIGAEVLDAAGEVMGTTPLLMKLLPEQEGKTLRITRDGYMEARHVLDLGKARAEGKAIVKLEPKPKPKPKKKKKTRRRKPPPRPTPKPDAKPKKKAKDIDKKWEDL